MAATDTIKVQKTYTDENGVTTIGIEERTTMPELMALMNDTPALAGSPTLIVTQTAPVVAPAAFADLTTAATAYNAMRTALIAAKVLKA